MFYYLFYWPKKRRNVDRPDAFAAFKSGGPPESQQGPVVQPDWQSVANPAVPSVGFSNVRSKKLMGVEAIKTLSDIMKPGSASGEYGYESHEWIHA
ncbi:MAG: hypothetical protein KGM95_08690 [Betaproteobacteria bacterium]|nr:hypothetical protein [Betaproteobacteria bacterium]